MAARRILLRLVTAEGMRARRTRAELGEDAATGDALEALVKGRLVVVREVSAMYEVTHEALLRAWATLRGWLDEDREQRRVRERVQNAAVEWARLGHAREALWTRRQLVEIPRLDENEIGQQGREFLAASRRRVRHARLATYAVAVAVLM